MVHSFEIEGSEVRKTLRLRVFLKKVHDLKVLNGLRVYNLSSYHYQFLI